MSRDRKAFDAAVKRQMRTADTAQTRTAPQGAPTNRRARRTAAARQGVPVEFRASTFPVLHVSGVTTGSVEFALNGRIVSASVDQLEALGVIRKAPSIHGFVWELRDAAELEATLVRAGVIEAKS